ncbi:MAG: hypothetical protein ABJA67_04450 [Chthonomonadales bacterium]
MKIRNIVLASICGATLFSLQVGSVLAKQNAPFAGGAQVNEKDPEVEKLIAAAKKLEKASKAKPKDAKLKAKAAEAYYQAGHTCMLSAKLSPKGKYRGALVQFRKSLSVDPSHKKAAEEKKMIEDIYKQMGRPVPQ